MLIICLWEKRGGGGGEVLAKRVKSPGTVCGKVQRLLLLLFASRTDSVSWSLCTSSHTYHTLLKFK